MDGVSPKHMASHGVARCASQRMGSRDVWVTQGLHRQPEAYYEKTTGLEGDDSCKDIAATAITARLL